MLSNIINVTIKNTIKFFKNDKEDKIKNNYSSEKYKEVLKENFEINVIMIYKFNNVMKFNDNNYYDSINIQM